MDDEAVFFESSEELFGLLVLSDPIVPISWMVWRGEQHPSHSVEANSSSLDLHPRSLAPIKQRQQLGDFDFSVSSSELVEDNRLLALVAVPPLAIVGLGEVGEGVFGAVISGGFGFSCSGVAPPTDASWGGVTLRLELGTDPVKHPTSVLSMDVGEPCFDDVLVGGFDLLLV